VSNSDSDEEKKVLDVLQGFFAAMYQWEASSVFAQAHKNIKARLQAYAELEQIFSMFCTEKERRKERESALRCDNCSEYDMRNQIIKEVKVQGSQAVVHIEQLHGLKNHHRFLLRKQSGRWKIDSKECLYQSDNLYYPLFNRCFAWKTKFDSEQERKAAEYAKNKKRVLTENKVKKSDILTLIEFFKKECLCAKNSTEVQEIGYTFDVYGKFNDGLLEDGITYYAVYDSTQYDEQGEGTCPRFVVENGLHLACSGDIFMDVIECAIEQGRGINKLPSAEFLLAAINYYLEYDDYLDFL